jgi:hypothetical protein
LKYWKTRKNKTKKRQWNHKVYRGVACGACAMRSFFTKSTVREKLLSKEGAATYFKRQYTIEPIFRHFKYNLVYRSFVLRGLAKVNAAFKFMCIGWNLQKM